MVEWIWSDVLLLPSPAEVEQSVGVRSELRKRALCKCVGNDLACERSHAGLSGSELKGAQSVRHGAPASIKFSSRVRAVSNLVRKKAN